jgi:hypothetical protein
LKHLSKHLTFANAISCIALFVALSGAAYAAKTTLGNKAVKTRNLANGSVTALKLGNGSVTTLKLKNGAVTEAKLFNSAVTNSKLGPNAVATGKIQDGAITSPKLASGLLAQLVRNVTYVNKASGAVSATSPQSVTAECPAGKQVIGGGTRVLPGDAVVVQITDSVPFLAGDGKRTGWTAAAKTAETTKTFAVEAHAICAEF